MMVSPLLVLIFWRTLRFWSMKETYNRTCSKVLLRCSWCTHQFSRALDGGGAAHHFPSRSPDLRHRGVFLWGNGRIVVCGCTGKVCQIRWTSRLLQVCKEELLRCTGWNRLPARRLTVHERSLLDTFATRNFLRLYFHVLLLIKRLRSFDMAWSPGVMFCVRCIYSCP